MEEILGIDSNTQVVGSFSQYDKAKITGSGRVRFTATLPNPSSRSLHLSANLDQTIANSSVSAIFYSSDATVPTNNGVIVTFSRNGLNVEVKIAIGNSEHQVHSTRLNFLYPAALDVIIDVHNNGSQARVLIWRKDRMGYSADTADVDTIRPGDMVTNLPVSSGGGGFVGLSLTNATVSAATIGAQKLLN